MGRPTRSGTRPNARCVSCGSPARTTGVSPYDNSGHRARDAVRVRMHMAAWFRDPANHRSSGDDWSEPNIGGAFCGLKNGGDAAVACDPSAGSWRYPRVPTNWQRDPERQRHHDPIWIVLMSVYCQFGPRIRDPLPGTPVETGTAIVILRLAVSFAKPSDHGGTQRDLKALQRSVEAAPTVVFQTWNRTPPPGFSEQLRDGCQRARGGGRPRRRRGFRPCSRSRVTQCTLRS